MNQFSKKLFATGVAILTLIGGILNAQSDAPHPQPPEFSSSPGFYDVPVSLSLTSSEEAAQVRYTLDGSEPDPKSPIYSTPLVLEKTTVVKAISLDHQGAMSAPQTGTFLVNEEVSRGFAVVSLSVDSVVLFDTISGHYTFGRKADWWSGKSMPNYWKRVEFPMHFEYFDWDEEGQKRKRILNQAIGGKIFGNFSRSLPQKSFRVTARKKYGKKRLKHQFFPNLEISRFKKLIIRNGGTDWNYLHFRDAFIQNWVAGKTFLDTQAARPCVLFLNGKYWGVYHLREYIDDHMLSSHHGLDRDSIDLMEASDLVKEGSDEGFKELWQFIDQNDLTVPANFDFVETELDVKNLTDYWAVELWAANWDWMDANVRFWRGGPTDRRWKYILWDLDRGLAAMKENGQSPIQFHLGKGYVPHVRILRALLKNEQFWVYFVNRHADLLNTIFVPAPMLAAFDSKVKLMDPEMPRHFDTWGKDFPNYLWGKETRGSYEEWANGHVGYARDFISKRQKTARDDLQEALQLDGQYILKLNMSPQEAGRIQVNTVKISDFPWEGTYFGGIPIKLTALPNPGYQFASWQNGEGEALSEESPSLTVTLDALSSISASFSPLNGGDGRH